MDANFLTVLIVITMSLMIGYAALDAFFQGMSYHFRYKINNKKQAVYKK